jgi:hypothetical protein
MVFFFFFHSCSLFSLFMSMTQMQRQRPYWTESWWPGTKAGLPLRVTTALPIHGFIGRPESIQVPVTLRLTSGRMYVNTIPKTCVPLLPWVPSETVPRRNCILRTVPVSWIHTFPGRNRMASMDLRSNVSSSSLRMLRVLPYGHP